MELGQDNRILRDLADRWRNSKFDSYFLRVTLQFKNVQEGRTAQSLDNIYRFMSGKDFINEFKMYTGPSLNLLISKQEEANKYTWYSIISGAIRDRSWRVWLGISVGMQFFSH